jgi:hypothetical protein
MSLQPTRSKWIRQPGLTWRKDEPGGTVGYPGQPGIIRFSVRHLSFVHLYICGMLHQLFILFLREANRKDTNKDL